MTYIFSSSINISEGQEVFFHLKQLLKSAGWTVPSSSDGTTFAAGDIISSSAQMSDNQSWFIVKQPLGATGSYGNVRREIAIQRDSDSDDEAWRAAYSYSASFTGSADATTLPSADDQVRIIGEEFPAFGYNTTVFSTNTTYKAHIGADNEPPYGFYVVTVPNGGGDPDFCFIMEGMAEGTTSSQDIDPYVFYHGDTGANLDILRAKTSTNDDSPTTATTGSIILTPACWFKKGETDELFTGVAANYFATAHGALIDGNSEGTTDPYDNSDVLLPMVWYRPASLFPPHGYKGIGKDLRWAVSPDRTTTDTLSTTTSGSQDKIIFANVAFPWDGSTPAV